jgi:hypothetical protein
MSRHRYVSPIWIAIAYAGFDKDSQIAWLEKGYQERSFLMTTLGNRNWNYLRADPRFTALVKKVGLPH